MKFKQKGEVIVMGDFNARTGVNEDILKIDKFDNIDLPFINQNNHILPRNSEDKTVNPRGRELIELCKALQLAILNGRKNGDIFGNFTSYQWNGNSVVDYALSTYNLYDQIENFTIGSFMPWISDHCPVHFKIKIFLKNEVPSTNPRIHKYEIYNSFHWDENSPNKFKFGLENCTNELEQIMNIPDYDVQKISTLFSKMIYKITKTENIRKRQKPSKVNQKWFDKDCIDAKEKLRRMGKWVKREPNNKKNRDNLNIQKRAFKKLTKAKKRKYKEDVVKNLYLSKGRGKIFWKYLEKLDKLDNQNNHIEKISLDSWKDYFESLYFENREPVYPPNSIDEGPLDHIITLDELLKASYTLKNGKSTGIDMISNEMLRCILENHPHVLLKLYNSTLQNNIIPSDWITSIISPVHKKGSKMVRENYRGISLISCVFKLFAAILNNRLMNFCKEKNILSEEQLGFIPGNRTSDAHLLLHNLIQDYCHKKGEKLYSCFVDFSKAFDTVPREILFKKLIACGISGKILNILQNIYTNDQCKVKIDNKLSETFKTNKGVKQGCILSPLLFNIFLSDLPKVLLKEQHKNPNLDDETKISCLLWADDLVLLSRSEDGLQKMISKLSEYTLQNGLKINTDKTKCMIFNKTGRHIRRNFKFDDRNIETVREYKYLGFLITPSGEVMTGLYDLKSRAVFAIYQLRNKMGEYFNRYPDITLHLFDALIKPIILYMSDFWGCLPLRKNNPIDIIQNKFLKQLLGVQVQTPTYGILLDTGQISLTLYAQKYCIKNWERIAIKKECNTLLQISYMNALKSKLPWPIRIKNSLSMNGLQNLYNNTGSVQAHKIYFSRIVDIFHQNAFADIGREDSKLRTYAHIKTDIGREPYLTKIKNIRERIMFTKFRLSNHSLMIEKGRYNTNKDRSDRFCPFCPGKIEDEIHFLMKCPCFDAHRKHLFKTIIDKNRVPYFQHADTLAKFKTLMTHAQLIQHTAHYINNCMLIRDYLLKQHKNNS